MTNEIVGWGKAIEPGATAAAAFAHVLRTLGIEDVYTIIGGGIAPLVNALHQSGLRIRHFRHEAGAAFAAHETSMVSGKPVVVCVTTGPGIYNALTGIAAARSDGGRILLLSGTTSPAMQGKGAVQETTLETMPADIFKSGSLFHFARILSDVRELPRIATELASGFQRPTGFVAHVSWPLSLQDEKSGAFDMPRVTQSPPHASAQALETVVHRLMQQRFGLWVGHGAMGAADEIRQLATCTGCGVMATPRAKGIFPENDPHYVGVSGAGAHSSVEQYMNTFAPDVLLVLGTRLGEVSSFWKPIMVPRGGFMHVDIDPSAFGAAYPQAETLGIHSEIRSFLQDLLAALPDNMMRQTSHGCTLRRPESLSPRNELLVRTPYLLQALQRLVVESSDALVLAESGNAFAWANHALRFSEPRRYRTSASFGSMGHFVTGVVGAALGRNGKALVLAGDGAMLMNNEINTAVAYDAQAVWIVLNDARYGLTEHGLEALGIGPIETRLPLTNFALFAQSQGASGRIVDRESDLEDALREALEARGPFVLDVRIDPNDVAPMLATRIASLKKQRGG